MSDPSVVSPYPGPGEVLDGKYRVEKLLGEGGMGAVARATHLLLQRTIAVKFMNPQFMTFPGAVERFLNEGRASGLIKSDHVVPCSDVGCLPSGTPYLVMECLYGLDLADLLARDGPSGLPIERTVHFLLQILRGLQSAHAIGIIHRDMKPSNCFVVTNDGEEDFVKILDFGISKIAQPGSASLTQTNSALGTPLYMSPEQARSPRDVDARSDLYSVGVILYELLCGRTPFFSESGEFTEILFQLFTADPPPIRQMRPDIPEALAVVVHKALAREVPERYASALEMAEALRPFASPRSLPLVEKMRGFRPPTKESVPPLEGLPTSMAAFSQLQRGGGTDIMANRPTTDIQKGPPVTEVHFQEGKPVQKKTEVLPQGANARSADELGHTQVQTHASSARTPPGVSTDLGASRDAAPATEAVAVKRSPLLYILPPLALATTIGVATMAVNYLRPAPTPATSAMTHEPPPPATTAIPSAPASTVPVVASAASAASSADVAATPSAGTSTKASTPKPVQTGGSQRQFRPGLDDGLHN